MACCGVTLRSLFSRKPIQVLAVVATALLAGAGVGLALTADESGDPESTIDPSTTSPDGGNVESPASDFPTSSSTTNTPTTTPTTTLPVGPQELAERVAGMSLEAKARQLLVVGVDDRDPAGGVEQSVGSMCVGGIFVARNWTPVDSPTAARTVISSIADAAVAEGCQGRPLIMTDAEPGTTVVKVPVTSLPSSPDLYERYVSGDETGVLATIATEGEKFAEEIAALGVHVNFGAIADVDVGPDYFMARQGRSFGLDAEAVAALSASFVNAHCAAGVAATLKHFPNQGATIEDPHGEPSYSDDSEADWRARGRIPYVDTTAPVVMTGHIFLDTDAERPASLSRAITTGLLREELGFEGVIVTDDLAGMVGITGLIPEPEQRAIEAIAAGADLALFVNSSGHDAVVNAIIARAIADTAFARQVDESAARVLRLKANMDLVADLDPAWFPLCDVMTAPFLFDAVDALPTVVVANATEVSGLAGTTAVLLAGLDATTQTANASPSEDGTRVYYADGSRSLAEQVADALGSRRELVEPAPSDITSRIRDGDSSAATVWVIIGEDHATAFN
jgi:beta-N-acetylhexosaminidase